MLGDAMKKAAASEGGVGGAAPLINAMCAQIVAKIDREPIYNLSAPQTLPIRQFDGAYRQRPIAADEEFTFKGCRVGARGQVIFEFKPMDPTKFDQMELEEKNVFTALGDFEAAVIASLEVSVPFRVNWAHASKAWIAAEHGRRKQEAIDIEAAAQKEVDDAYGSNSAFGSW